jgi:hypothetical protein
MRQLGSSTLAMPDIPQATADSSSFGPTFTFTTGPLPPSQGVVAPGNFLATGTTGLNTLLRGSGFPRSYQMQFSSAVLSGLPVGARITDLRFRLSTNATANFPTNDVRWTSYEVTLAQAANSIGNMTTNFDLNMVSPVLVRSGALSITGNTFTSGATPNTFAPLVVFGTAYIYKGGDLIMLFRHTGSDSTTSAFLDGVSQASSGYGTDFRAFSANSFSATGGAQASITVVEIGFAYSVNQTISRDGTNVVIVGTGGPPGGSYRVISATNITLPASMWSPAASNRFDASGNLRYTNALRKDAPAQFFRIAP